MQSIDIDRFSKRRLLAELRGAQYTVGLLELCLFVENANHHWFRHMPEKRLNELRRLKLSALESQTKPLATPKRQDK